MESLATLEQSEEPIEEESLGSEESSRQTHYGEVRQRFDELSQYGAWAVRRAQEKEINIIPEDN